MKVRLYESQLNRTEETGARPLTAQINPRTFSALAGAATEIGTSLFQLGAEKLRYDQANERLDVENKATVALISFQDKAQDIIRKASNDDPTVSHTAVPEAIKKLYNTTLLSLKDNKKVQEKFGVNGLKVFSNLKQNFLSTNLQKKIDLGKSNVQTNIDLDIKIAGDSGGSIVERLQAAEDGFAKIAIAQTTGVYDAITANTETKNLNYKLVESSIASAMNATDNAFGIALAIEDGEYKEDIIFNKYFTKLSSDQQEKIIKYAQDKANSVDNLLEAEEKKENEEEEKKIKELKRSLDNIVDIKDGLPIFNQLISMQALSLTERQKYEKFLNISRQGAAGSAAENDPTILAEIATIKVNNQLDEEYLLQNYSKLTNSTFTSERKGLLTELNAAEKKAKEELKNTFRVSEEALEAFSGDLFHKKLIQGYNRYYNELIDFTQAENRSVEEIENKVENLKKKFADTELVFYKQDLKEYIVIANRQLAQGGFGRISQDTPLQDIYDLIRKHYDDNPNQELPLALKTVRDNLNDYKFMLDIQ